MIIDFSNIYTHQIIDVIQSQLVSKKASSSRFFFEVFNETVKTHPAGRFLTVLHDITQ